MRSKTFLLFPLLTFSFMSNADFLNVEVETFTEVKSFPAEVKIKNGQVVASNCDTLTKMNKEGAKYTLKSVDSKFLCVPDNPKKSHTRILQMDIGTGEVIETIKEIFNSYGKSYEKINDIKNGFFSQVASAPSCNITADGKIDYASCVCTNGSQKFNLTKKSCESSDTVFAAYVEECTQKWSDVVSVLNIAGVSILPQSDISFGSCSTQLVQYEVLQHPLVYKMLYFAYFKDAITLHISQEIKGADVRIAVTGAELKEADAWMKEFASTSSQSTSSVLIEKAERFNWQIKNHPEFVRIY